jgi:hypothetical protein
MAGTETAVPTLTSVISSSTSYRDRYRPTQPNMIDDAFGGTGLQVTNASDVAVNVANGGAIVEGVRYDLTGGPMVLAVASNTGASANRFDVVVLTYDASHNPAAYLRIIKGTAGAGLPALTNVYGGVWDFPIAHYEKQSAGPIVNLRDRRKFSDGCGGTVGADDTTGTNGVGWFPPNPRTNQRQRFLPSGNRYTYTPGGFGGPSAGWYPVGSTAVTAQATEGTTQNTSSTTYTAGSPTCSATIVAPASGQFIVTAETYGTSHSDHGEALNTCFQVRMTSSSGAIILDTLSDRESNMASLGNSTSLFRHVVTGLTPGATYYVQHMIRSQNGGSVTAIGRQLILESAG